MAVERVEIPYRESRANLYHVPKKQWAKWPPAARQVFNEVYSAMVRDQGMFLHPKQEKLTRSHWKTTAWNAAWFGASAVSHAS